jgi:hypothetical protein
VRCRTDPLVLPMKLIQTEVLPVDHTVAPSWELLIMTTGDITEGWIQKESVLPRPRRIHAVAFGYKSSARASAISPEDRSSHTHKRWNPNVLITATTYRVSASCSFNYSPCPGIKAIYSSVVAQDRDQRLIQLPNHRISLGIQL